MGSIFIGRWIHLPMMMEPTEGSETSDFRTQTPGNYPEEKILDKEHGESLKSGAIVCLLLAAYSYGYNACISINLCHRNRADQPVFNCAMLCCPLWTSNEKNSLKLFLGKDEIKHRKNSDNLCALFHEDILNCSGSGSSVSIATELGAGRSGIESRWGRDFPPVQTGPGTNPASCKVGIGFSPGVKCGRGVLLATHPF